MFGQSKTQRKIRKIERWFEQADHAYDIGTDASMRMAVAINEQAVQDAQRLVEADRGSLEAREVLFQALLKLSDRYAEAGPEPKALQALNECVAMLAESGGGQAQVAEIRLRRARVHALAGHPLSALPDAHAALVMALADAASEPGSTSPITLAQQLSRYASIVFPFGDPDVTVAAADRAIDLFVTNEDDANADPAQRPHNAQLLMRAAELAEAVHGAFGRTGEAQAATTVTEAVRATTSVDHQRPLDAIDPDWIRARTALPDALTRVGATGVSASLGDAPSLTVADRLDLTGPPDPALEMARCAEDAAERDPDAAQRVIWDAHTWFAVASEAGNQHIVDRYEEVTARWTSMLGTSIKISESLGDQGAGEDLTRWREALIAAPPP